VDLTLSYFRGAFSYSTCIPRFDLWTVDTHSARGVYLLSNVARVGRPRSRGGPVVEPSTFPSGIRTELRLEKKTARSSPLVTVLFLHIEAWSSIPLLYTFGPQVRDFRKIAFCQPYTNHTSRTIC
jgi:hypothetical protein